VLRPFFGPSSGNLFLTSWAACTRFLGQTAAGPQLVKNKTLFAPLFVIIIILAKLIIIVVFFGNNNNKPQKAKKELNTGRFF